MPSTTLHRVLSDNVIFRNLTPIDAKLPGLADLAGELGIDPRLRPRKAEVDYARVVARILQAASSSEIAELIYIGDTRFNDGAAWTNLCSVIGCPGIAFIGAETSEPPHIERIEESAERVLLLSNRWSQVDHIETELMSTTNGIGPSTAVIVDLDKTLIGARGRNDLAIDSARLAAVERTLADLLGENFDKGLFTSAYRRFNGPEFHHFTTDNQDYLAYICLVIGTKAVNAEELAAAINAGQLHDFKDFLSLASDILGLLPYELVELHDTISRRVKAGDPTPFKAFRRNEYLETVERMGASALPGSEIAITAEVFDILHDFKQRGALIFGLSDKPDEASIPTPRLAGKGFQPLHRTEARLSGYRNKNARSSS